MMSISDYGDFSIRGFINEVHKRAEIWDTSHPDYKNREQRQNAWLQICSVFVPNLADKEEDAQLMVGKLTTTKQFYQLYTLA